MKRTILALLLAAFLVACLTPQSFSQSPNPNDYGTDDYQKYGMLFDKKRQQTVEQTVKDLFEREQKNGYFAGGNQESVIRDKVKKHIALQMGVYPGKIDYDDDSTHAAVKKTNDYFRSWRSKMTEVPNKEAARQREQQTYREKLGRVQVAEQEKREKYKAQGEAAIQQLAEKRAREDREERDAAKRVKEGRPRTMSGVDDYIKEFTESLKERNKVARAEIGIVGYCWQKAAGCYTIKSTTCHEPSINFVTGLLFDDFRREGGCADPPKFFAIWGNGEKTEIGSQDRRR